MSISKKKNQEWNNALPQNATLYKSFRFSIVLILYVRSCRLSIAFLVLHNTYDSTVEYKLCNVFAKKLLDKIVVNTSVWKYADFFDKDAPEVALAWAVKLLISLFPILR